MSKPSVLITRKIPEPALQILQKHCDCEIWEETDTPVPRDVLKEKIQGKDGLYVLITDRVDAELMDQATSLKVISTMSVGYDHIDIHTASQKGIAVTHTPGVLTETTADLTFALMMAAARRITESERYLREGKWETWSPMQLTGQDIYGKTLGIIGMGRIGEAVARRATGFDMKILYHNRNRNEAAEKRVNASHVSLQTLLKESDYVCVLTPLTPETHHLIGEAELSLMKPSAILINSSRGPTVDEQALYRALKEKKIWAAGLDVYEKEPIGPGHPLLELDRIVLLPHIGSASIETRTRMAVMAAEDLVAGLTGQKPVHLVNPEVWNQGT
ncbi:MAG: D-glycerate dehydrogenase [Bacillaceae bacterium]|nr:D-glycerate dehydrogenase [Bacillaceae bacterium]